MLFYYQNIKNLKMVKIITAIQVIALIFAYLISNTLLAVLAFFYAVGLVLQIADILRMKNGLYPLLFVPNKGEYYQNLHTEALHTHLTYLGLLEDCRIGNKKEIDQFVKTIRDAEGPEMCDKIKTFWVGQDSSIKLSSLVSFLKSKDIKELEAFNMFVAEEQSKTTKESGYMHLNEKRLQELYNKWHGEPNVLDFRNGPKPCFQLV